MESGQSCERDVIILLASGSLTLSVLRKGDQKNSFGTGRMPFPQAPAGARRILGGWRRSGWLWCCGRSCWWCSRRMTKRSSPEGSGRGRRGLVREGYKVVARPDLHFEGAGNGPVVKTWIGRERVLCYVLTFWPGQKMLFQGDAPEGSDTFQWPVIERDRVGGLRLIIWDKIKVPLCHYSDGPEESDLWTAWQLFPLDDD